MAAVGNLREGCKINYRVLSWKTLFTDSSRFLLKGTSVGSPSSLEAQHAHAHGCVEAQDTR
jgi:hypothetical protein